MRIEISIDDGEYCLKRIIDLPRDRALEEAIEYLQEEEK